MIFFDWDGTLVDLWPRYYQVFCKLTGATELSFEQYKREKQFWMRDNDVATAVGLKLPDDYFEQKACLLEEMEFLALDTLWLDCNKMKELFSDCNAMVLTKRRRPENLVAQIDGFGLQIPVAIVGEETKRDWIGHYYPNKKSYIVGDHITDLKTATLSNVSAFMVGYGLGTRKQFDQCHLPYTFLSNVEELLEVVKRGME